MKILQSALRGYAVLGLGQHKSTQKYPLNKENLQTLIILCIAISSTSVYLFHEAKTFQDYTVSVYTSSSVIHGFVGYVIFIWKNQPICELIENVQKALNERLNQPAAKANYMEIHLQVEKWQKIIHFGFMRILLYGIVFQKFMFCFYFYYTTDLGPEAFELPFPFWMPFDLKTPSGYLFAVTIVYLLLMRIYLFAAVSLSLEIGIGSFVMEFIKDIQNDNKSIIKMNKPKKSQSKVMDRLRDSIQFHSKMKELVNDASDIAQPLLTALFAWSLVTICGALLIGQTIIVQYKFKFQSSGGIGMEQIIIPLFQLSSSFSLVFIVCEVLGRMSHEIDAINEILSQFKWYLFPKELQKILPTILIHAEKPVNINCFGSIPCNRETFKKVVKSGFSYFMMLRQFGI